MLLTGWHVPIFSQPDLGVDLFVMLSGFLMVYQYQLREASAGWSHPGAWTTFWVRRFFRIAPLFYVALAVAVIAGPHIYEARTAIDGFLGVPQQRPERYLDASASNIALHVSFLFGMLPSYAFRTPLPDWSLGLEMQFYAVFPILMLMIRRIGWVAGAALIAMVGVTLALVTRRAGVEFPMPAFLPLKMHIFLCGMVLAAALEKPPQQSSGFFAAAALLALIPIGGEHGFGRIFVREAIVAAFFVLVLHDKLPSAFTAIAGWFAKLLGAPFFHWLGELSFGAYLIHLLVLQPVIGQLVMRFGHELSAPIRFFIAVLISLPITYIAAFLTYRFVEGPGQKLGRLVLARMGLERRDVLQNLPETIAAP